MKGALPGLAVAALPALAALGGSLLARPVALNLGPGDAPYVAGFAPAYEIQEKVATHWTSYDAAIELPLSLRGAAAELRFRFARVLPETAVVDVLLDGRIVDHFSCRGGVFEERRVALGRVSGTPLRLAFHVDSHDRKGLGLKLDWVRVEGARSRLSGSARWTPALLLALLFFLLRWSGWDARRAALLALPCSLLAAFGLLTDPWLVHRLLFHVPVVLAVAGGLGIALGRILVVRGAVAPATLRTLAALGAAAFLARALAVSHPAFYYPDLRTHASLVEAVQDGGLDFLWHPAAHIWNHGLWRIQAHGKTYAFPYTPAFHVPFALASPSYDDLLAWMKLWAVVASVVPLVLVWAIARRVGAPALGCVLMLLVPTYTSRLSFAFLPATFGHAWDMALLAWLAGHLAGLRRPAVLAAGAVLVAASQLAYVSGVINTAVLVVCLAALDPWEREGSRLAQAARILAMGLLGALLAVLVYYRDFLGMLVDVAARAASGAPAAASRYPIQGWLAVTCERTRDFFGFVYPPLAVLGLALAFRRRASGRFLLAAWGAAYLLLLLGRARVPDLFLHGHETLLVTPLVCLTAGEALAWLWGRGLAARALAGAAFAWLFAEGLVLQWRAIADQLGNAL
jgi:hypothetical protein